MRNSQHMSTAATMSSASCHHISGSPNSSEEIESQHGTPETKLTAFSPEDVRLQPRLAEFRTVRSNLPPAFALGQSQDHLYPTLGANTTVTFGCPDPFVNNASTAYGSCSSTPRPRLSPDASSFTPLGSREHGHSPGLQSSWESGAANSQYRNILWKPDYLSGESTYDTCINDCSPETLGVASMYKPSKWDSVSTSANSTLKIEVVPVKVGKFSSDGDTARSLIISDVPPRTSPKEIDEFFSLDIFSSLKDLVLADLVAAGRIYLNLTDIRDAHKAHAKVQSHRKDWNVQYIAGTKYVTKQPPDSSIYKPLPRYDGQVILRADFSGPRQQFNATRIGHLIRELLENYGEIMGYEACLSKHPIATYRAEFYNTTATNSALSYLNGFKIGGCTLSIAHYRLGRERLSHHSGRNPGPFIIGHQETGLERALDGLDVNRYSGTHHNQLLGPSFVPALRYAPSNDRSSNYQREYLPESLSAPAEVFTPPFTARSSATSPPWSPAYSSFSSYGLHSPVWATYYPGAIGQERGVPVPPQVRSSHPLQRHAAKSLARQEHEYKSAHHNIVDVERIRQGTDVRTTIMLRNIPNKIDQAMLKDIVDETSHGKYDFMYLRIVNEDFANNCNVGYAFINFEDPYFIIDFVNARAGHRWNRYSSDKVAEVSYATIQGRDCLVQKFRNSSVMLEHPGFRPKIFHTGKGGLAGTEDTFPGPDNPSKMRRSVENAEHVGLFAPRAGQTFRDEQRRRRSQYDRGTRLAEMEDAYDFDHVGLGNEANHLYAPASHMRKRGYSHQLPETR